MRQNVVVFSNERSRRKNPIVATWTNDLMTCNSNILRSLQSRSLTWPLQPLKTSFIFAPRISDDDNNCDSLSLWRKTNINQNLFILNWKEKKEKMCEINACKQEKICFDYWTSWQSVAPKDKKKNNFLSPLMQIIETT